MAQKMAIFSPTPPVRRQGVEGQSVERQNVFKDLTFGILVGRL